jgi:hypothetical protein
MTVYYADFGSAAAGNPLVGVVQLDSSGTPLTIRQQTTDMGSGMYSADITLDANAAVLRWDNGRSPVTYAHEAISDTAGGVLASVVDGTTTLAESIRLQNAILLGKVSGAGSGTEIFRDLADTKDRVTATVDSSGNRTAITLDAT